MRKRNEQKLIRIQHVNDLVKIISSYGRRFFFHAGTGMTARMLMDQRGRLWWQGEYTGELIFTHKTTWTNRWRGFSHGGTLRDLVEMMRDYVLNGEPLPSWVIGPERRLLTDGNIWGYPPEYMQVVRDKAMLLPIIAAEGINRES